MHITHRTHGILDYVVAGILILSPRLFGFEPGGAAAWVPRLLGFAALGYSLLTDYELGVFKVLSFKAHLALDTASAILVALSPWLFAFTDQVWAPHLLLGLAELGVVLITPPTTAEEQPGPPGTPAHS